MGGWVRGGGEIIFWEQFYASVSQVRHGTGDFIFIIFDKRPRPSARESPDDVCSSIERTSPVVPARLPSILIVVCLEIFCVLRTAHASLFG